MNFPSQEREELDFLAFQYVSDELAEGARTAFEERLLDDQAAREAVAGAVEMALAAQAAFRDDAEMVEMRQQILESQHRFPWWNVALACCALVVLVVVSRFARPPQTPGVDRAKLAIAWSEARSEWPASVLDEELLADGLLSDPLEDEVALPTWMLAAVSEQQPDMDEGKSGDSVPE